MQIIDWSGRLYNQYFSQGDLSTAKQLVWSRIQFSVDVDSDPHAETLDQDPTFEKTRILIQPPH